jgi:hypothetical protein
LTTCCQSPLPRPFSLASRMLIVPWLSSSGLAGC